MRSFLAALAALSLFAIGCTDLETGDTTPAHDCGPGKTRSYLISTLAFTRIDEATGQAPGFDVDGVVSTGEDAGSCFKKDFVGEGGETGIDNQIAVFVPELEKLLGNAVDGLVQGAINNGDLLIMLNVDGAESVQDDECVDLTVELANGKPTLGTDGVIEAYQTFDFDTQGEISHAISGKIEDRELTIGPFELAIPIAIFDVAFTVHVHRALIRFAVDAEDGTLKSGYVGGGIVPQEIIDGVNEGAGVAQYTPLLSIVLNQSADLEPDADGVCQQISIALAITAVEAFVRR